MLSFSSQLHTLLASPYPYVYLATYEEDRVTAVVRSLATGMQRSTLRFVPEDFGEPGPAFDAWLDELLSAPPGSIGIACDVHPWLGVPDRVRGLRVAAGTLGERGTTLVFVSPVAVEPIELAKDWVIVDVPLPERDELGQLLDATLPADAFPRIERERLALAALGLTRREAHRAFERAKHLHELTAARGRPFDWEAAVVEEKRRLMAAASALEFSAPGTNLDDVGGLDELKRWVHERRAAFGQGARDFGLPAPKGLMLVGVQGCGKSLAAKAVAGFWGLPLLRLDLGALFSGAQAPDVALRAATRSAEAMAPCVLWVDEIEKGFGAPDGETARLLGSLLVWLQEKHAPVFFVATANAVDQLPPELLRRGRFDELFFVDLPDLRARIDILGIHLGARRRRPSDFDLATIAGLCENFSGAELEQVVVAAMYRAFADERDLATTDLTTAARELVPLYKLREKEIKALRTWAKDRARQAGHDRSLTDYFTDT